MRNEERFGELDALDNWQLADSGQDIRGRPLVSPTGERHGIIEDMLVDTGKEHVAAIRLDDGRMCGVNFLDIAGDHVVYREPAPDYVPVYHRVTTRRT